jgi:rod shape-determining protein MreD
MKYLIRAFVVFLALFLQTKITILGVPPNLTVILAFYAGIRYGETRGLVSGAFLGTLEDIVSRSIIGPNLLGKGVVGYSSAFLISGGIFRWTPLLGIVAISLLTLVDNCVIFLSRTLLDTMPAEPGAALYIAVMQSLLNAPAGLFIRPRHAE